MPNWKEFRFNIQGQIGGEEITPQTLPMTRLAEYLTALSTMMGHKESVHFVAMAEGSAQAVMNVDEDEESRVVSQVKHALLGTAQTHANAAYKKIDKMLREDNAVGEIFNSSRNAKVIEFPGRRIEMPDAYGPINEQLSIVGTLKRVGGFDESIPVHVQRADGKVFCCDAELSLAKGLGAFYEKTVRVSGTATYYRVNGDWQMRRFHVQSYDPLITDEPFYTTVNKLRSIPGSEWSEMEQPFEELRRLRHGEEA